MDRLTFNGLLLAFFVICIVDTYIKEDTLIFPLKLVYEGPLEDLDIENIKELFSKNGYTFDIH